MEDAASKKVEQRASLAKNANWLSFLYSWWAIPLLRLGNSRELELEDISGVLSSDSAVRLGSRLSRAWRKELQKTSPSLLRAILSTFGLRFIYLSLVCTVASLLPLAQSLLIGYLILYFEREFTELEGYGFAVLLIVTNQIAVILYQYVQFGCLRMGMNIRVAVSTLLYTKSLRLSQRSLSATGVGKAMNMLSNDANRYALCMRFLPYLLAVPLQLVTLIALIWTYIGLSFMAGVALLVIIIPVQGMIGFCYGKARASVAKKSERRISLLSEVISGIQLIKIFCWEKPFAALLGQARKDEIGKIRVKLMVQTLNATIFQGSSKLVILLSLLQTAYFGVCLRVNQVFVGFSLYRNAQLSVTEWFPQGTSRAVELVISTRRIQTFLLLEEMQSAHRLKDVGPKGIRLLGVSARWVPDKDHQLTLTDINLQVGPKDLLVVAGVVGSSKSSLLQLVLGELEAESGLVSVSGRVAYSPQEPWLFSGTIRENILLGAEYEEDWYKKVVDACALKQDFALFPEGDLAPVGEKGVSLSGGQRARISFARAVYSKADIYLLDDPLSAVDVSVARHLLTYCIQGLLSDKCVILVTHHYHSLPGDTRVLILNKGSIFGSGMIQDFRAELRADAPFVETTVDALGEDETEEKKVSSSSLDKAPTKDYGTFIRSSGDKEMRSFGSVTWSLYLKYFSAGNGPFVLFIFLTSYIGSQVLFDGSDYFLKFMVDQQSKSLRSVNETLLTTSRCGISSNIEIYAWLTGAAFLAAFLKTQLLYYVCVESSSAIYNSAFNALLRAPMRFFERNSSGAIMNRLTNDVGVMDEEIPTIYYGTSITVFEIIGTIVVIAILKPILLVFILPSIPLIAHLRNIYLKSAFSVKRLEGISRSPVFANMSTTLLGLSTIRSFESQDFFQQKFLQAQDAHSSVYFIYIALSNCCSMVACSLSTTLLAITVFSFMLGSTGDSSVGLALSMVLVLNMYFIDGVKFTTDLSNQMVSVERVMEYSGIQPEAPLEKPDRRPNKNWPSLGQVSMDRLRVQYGDGPVVLHDISLHLKPSEKVGVVGRTGAGKSSLVSALFRLTEPTSGRILIDGLNVLELGLHDIRSVISFIPQNPVLFSGTVRRNLDPFGRYSDSELWDALNQVQLQDRMSVVAGAGLDTMITESGGNFSQGERQLLCLARTMLSNNKIIVLDEATANIDPRTDAIIQSTLRTSFEGCTVIVVAHRLETVMELDKVFVMGAGRVLEFDEPIRLLDKGPGGRLFDLVAKTGEEGARRLRALASKKRPE